MTQAGPHTPLARCVHACLDRPPSPHQLGAGGGPKLRRSSGDSTEHWLSQQAGTATLRHAKHALSARGLRGESMTGDKWGVDAEGHPRVLPGHSSFEAGDDTARRSYIHTAAY